MPAMLATVQQFINRTGCSSVFLTGLLLQRLRLRKIIMSNLVVESRFILVFRRAINDCRVFGYVKYVFGIKGKRYLFCMAR